MEAELDRDVVAAQRAFERWRGSSTRGERIPKELWSRAVVLAKRVGVSRTAIALRLDYYSLQGRVGSVKGSGFLELSGAQLGVTEVRGEQHRVVVELRRDRSATPGGETASSVPRVVPEAATSASS